MNIPTSIKGFVVYILAFLLASIASMMFVKKLSHTFSNQGKKPLIFNLVISTVASLSAFGTTWLSQSQFTIFWIFSALFLLFGFLFVVLIHKKYFKARKDNQDRQFLAEILFAFSILLLCITMFSSMQFFIKKTEFLLYPTMLSLLFFLLPILLLYTFNEAYSIPAPIYSSWQYPINESKDIPDEEEGEMLYVIGFEIAKKPRDTKRTFFRAKAPENMLLGDLFYFFMNDYMEQFSETPIIYKDGDEIFNWYFRTKPKWYQFSRILDFKKTVKENKIKENTVIICERVESSN